MSIQKESDPIVAANTEKNIKFNIFFLFKTELVEMKRANKWSHIKRPFILLKLDQKLRDGSTPNMVANININRKILKEIRRIFFLGRYFGIKIDRSNQVKKISSVRAIMQKDLAVVNG
ncbi:MAG: hypothetical protein U9Q96_00115 [Patescibacteria group bacterium]|nr:hypothetical protein [Patescibacteria group bacterium]